MPVRPEPAASRSGWRLIDRARLVNLGMRHFRTEYRSFRIPSSSVKFATSGPARVDLSGSNFPGPVFAPEGIMFRDSQRRMHK